MPRNQAFFRAGLAAGMSREDVVTVLLDGSVDLGTTIGEILGDFDDSQEMVRIAVATLKVTDDLQAVSTALTGCGLHPLSLLCSGGADLQTWIKGNPERERGFYANQRWPCTGYHCGSFRIERLRASKWLKALQPGLKLIFDDAADTLVLSDSCLTGLLDADMALEMNLKIMACKGRVRLPSRIRGRLQLRFSKATRSRSRKRDTLSGRPDRRGLGRRGCSSDSLEGSQAACVGPRERNYIP